MTSLYKVIRALIVTLLALAIGVPLLLYIVLSVDSVQSKVRDIGQRELSSLLGADVRIGHLDIQPFNKLVLQDVDVIVAPGDTALKAKRLSAGILLKRLVVNRRIIFSHAEIIGLDLSVARDSLGAPLNIQPIIDKLSPKEKNKPPTRYDVRINNIVMRQGRLRYDVRNQSAATDGKIDFNHLDVRDIKADILIPRIKHDRYIVDLRRLSLKERSGLSLENLSGKFDVSPEQAKVTALTLSLPRSLIAFKDMEVKYNDWNNLKQNLYSIPFDVVLTDNCYVTPADLMAFVPELGDLTDRLWMELDVSGPLNDISLNNLNLSMQNKSLNLFVRGSVAGLPDKEMISYGVKDLKITADAPSLISYVTPVAKIDQKTAKIIAGLGHVSVEGDFDGNFNHVDGTLNILSGLGNIIADASCDMNVDKRNFDIHGELKADSLNVSALDQNIPVTKVAVSADGTVSMKNSSFVAANLNIGVPELTYKNHSVNNISARIEKISDIYEGWIHVDDEALSMLMSATVDISKNNYSAIGECDLQHFDASAFGLLPKYTGYILSTALSMNMHGPYFENLDGRIDMKNFRFVNPEAKGIELERLSILSSGSTVPQYITLSSDIIDGQLIGSYKFKSVVPQLKRIIAQVVPAAFEKEISHDRNESPTEALFTFDIKENATTEQWLSFFKSPVNILQNVTFSGSLNSAENYLSASLSAPSLLQKEKFIDNTSLNLSVEGDSHTGNIYFTTIVPSKKGEMTLELSASAENNLIDSRVMWNVAHKRKYNGSIDLTTLLSRIPENNNLRADVNVNKSNVIINDTTWVVHPAEINVNLGEKYVAVHDFDVSRDNQFIKIDGTVSSDSDDELCLQLRNIDLDYVFETLDIGNAMFGGVATGDFYASNLFSSEPHLSTPLLHVDRLSYNHALMGDADIVSRWNNSDKGISILADIKQPNGHSSKVDGAIYPLADSLDFRFTADKLNVKFMKPYMEAFTSDIDGYASGDARLYGTFKLIDMTGEIWAEDLRIKLDFTNTYYTTSDSIHLTPGRISFSDVVLRDMYSNEAKLTGWVTHKCFKEPEFEFNVFDARNFLCYDVNEKINPIWYGHVFCNGGANIKGVPGYIDMNVNISTAPQSSFTFVLSDTEAAEEYTFLSFHDRDEVRGNLLLSVEDPVQANIRRLKEYYAHLHDEEQSASIYRMNLLVDVNPQAEMILVMDPVGGDRIKARGNGNLRMEYNSADEDLRMFGTYTLTQGSYNFTLQDIIIKDFTIKPGSSIAFHGDPYSAVLDIDAVYQVNANLSDLDESFLQDRELNRTKVPVHALLKVDGVMQEPDISFDLEFPTLTQDTYRKVKSIVSTEDMMNRQIIYLLALNRFYTPDYMASTTKGNELFSVASSTISSQLSSMLGQLSDNWTIAPSIRSDRGDFSDTEVDLALSSYLLDNRLLFNGNFGYRDKAMNNNSFIGDFDIEYLLNRSGNIRLKAYNRYNDQNYYVKSALTTQGVGVIFKKDFDSFLSFLRKWRKPKKKEKPEIEHNADSVVSEDTDWLMIKPSESEKSVNED